MNEIRQSNAESSGETERLLKMLRKRIGYLMQEVQRLRRKNSSMEQRLEELEERVSHEGALVMLEDDPDSLRERLHDYIAAIDQQLGDGDNS